MNTVAHQFTQVDQLRMWWTLHGALTRDLAVYYTICGLAGFMQDYWLGMKIVGVW